MSNEMIEQNTTVQMWRSPQEVVQQVAHIQHVMAAVMREGEHYGKIPGASKNGLFKAGAEKLCFTFRLFPSFEIQDKDLGNGHREYVVKCSLCDTSGVVLGQGVGSCSTMESKYRYRNGADYEVTGEPIPKDSKERKSEYRRQGYGMKQVDGVWEWVRYKSDSKTENPDIADTWNTVLKMAKKRALVDASITACAASDIFTQDIEDLPEYRGRIKDPDDIASQAGDARAPRGAQVLQPSEEVAAILADICTAAGALTPAAQDRVRADLEAAGNNIDALANILAAVQESVERRSLEAKALGIEPEKSRAALEKWLAGKPPLQKIRDLIAKQSTKPTTTDA